VKAKRRNSNSSQKIEIGVYEFAVRQATARKACPADGTISSFGLYAARAHCTQIYQMTATCALARFRSTDAEQIKDMTHFDSSHIIGKIH
jgi:hypothetical protein